MTPRAFIAVWECNHFGNHRKGQLCASSWHPNGGVFAIPGKDGDIEIIERDTWKRLFTLQKGHHKVILGIFIRVDWQDFLTQGWLNIGGVIASLVTKWKLHFINVVGQSDCDMECG